MLFLLATYGAFSIPGGLLVTILSVGSDAGQPVTTEPVQVQCVLTDPMGKLSKLEGMLLDLMQRHSFQFLCIPVGCCIDIVYV